MSNTENAFITTGRKPKTQKCQGCPAYENDGRCVGSGSPFANIVFIGSSPKELADYESGVYSFADHAGGFFKKIFRQVCEESPDWDKNVIPYYIHAAQCAGSNSAEVIKHCSAIVHPQIANTRAKVIVPLGADAMRSLGLTGSVKNLRGKICKIRVNGKMYDCVPTYSPSALLRKENTGLLQTYKADLRVAIAKSVGKAVPLPPISELTKNYRIAKTVAEGKAICKEILEHRNEDGKKPILAVDTETTALETWRTDFKIIAISFAWGPGDSAAILLNHRKNEEDWTELIPDLRAVLESDIPKVFHNWKYDLKVLLYALGWEVKAVAWDTMAGEYLLDENKVGYYDLKTIVRTRVPAFTDYEKRIKDQLRASEDTKETIDKLKGEVKKLTATIKGRVEAKKEIENKKLKSEAMKEIKELREEKKTIQAQMKELKEQLEAEEKKSKEMTFEDINVDDMLLYAAIDTDCTRQICRQQIDEVNKEDPDLKITMKMIMLPGARVLGYMEHYGVKVDLEYLKHLEDSFEQIIKDEQNKIFDLIGKEINLNSTQQLEGVLVSDLGIKLTTRTKKDKGYKLDEDVLDSIKDQHPCIGHIVRWRKAYKAKNTFLEGIRSKSEYDGRIHANYNNTTTATGRLSSSGPNMQNVPSRGILGHNIKKLFIPDSEDEIFVDMDYSGAEIRVLTAYAQDENLINSLNEGLSVHSYVASEVFGIDYDEIQRRGDYYETDKEKYLFLDSRRQRAKSTVFLTIYGGGAKTLHANLSKDDPTITFEDCENTINTFLNKFPIIKKYMAYIKRHVDKHHFVKTKFGRRRRFPLAGLDWKLKNDSYREGINAPIQSTSADLVMYAMIVMLAHADEIGFKPRVTVHDSIGFTIPKQNLEKVRGFLDKYAEEHIGNVFKWLPVPFEYEADWGPSYGECKNTIK
jgi:uracil-DNA glycosylase family 4